MANKKSFLNHFLVIGCGTLMNMLVGFLTTPLITRVVGTEEYGQYSIFTMYASIALMVLCMGLDQALIRFFYREDSEDYRRTLLKECWMLPLLACVILGAGLNILCYSGVIHLEFDNFVVSMLTLCVLFQVLNRLDLILLRVSYKTKLYSAIQVAYKVLFAGLALAGCLILKKNYFHILVAATTVSYAIVTVVGIVCQRRMWKFWAITEKYRINRQELYKYAFPFIISMGITTIFQAIDKISLNMYCSYSDVGIYASAMTLVHIFSIVQTTFNSLWAPAAMEHYESHPEDREFHLQGNRIITLIMFCIGFSLILVKDIFSLVLGRDFREAAYILPFLIFNPIMLTISETTVVGITFKKKSNMHIVVAAVSCVVNIIGNAILVPVLGCRGAAISTGVSYIVFFVARTQIANHYYVVKWKLTRFWVVTVVAVIYAGYNTFFRFGLPSLLGYFAAMAILLLLYKDAVADAWSLALQQIRKLLMKKRA